MNPEYVQAFVENFKKKFADLHSINVELETVLSFKDKEIEELKKKLEEAEKNAIVVDTPAA